MSIINPSGKEIFSVTTEFCGRPLTLEVNRVGFRTTGSVLVRYGDTVVLGSAQVSSRPVQLIIFRYQLIMKKNFMLQVRFLVADLSSVKVVQAMKLC